MDGDGNLAIDHFRKFSGKQCSEYQNRSFDTLIAEIDGFTGSSDSEVVGLLFLQSFADRSGTVSVGICFDHC